MPANDMKGFCEPQGNWGVFSVLNLHAEWDLHERWQRTTVKQLLTRIKLPLRQQPRHYLQLLLLLVLRLLRLLPLFLLPPLWCWRTSGRCCFPIFLSRLNETTADCSLRLMQAEVRHFRWELIKMDQGHFFRFEITVRITEVVVSIPENVV